MTLATHRFTTAVVFAAALLLVTTAAAQPPTSAPANTEPPDPVCDVLFRNYVCGGKVNSDDRAAAIQLVASRGRNIGYWRKVLKTLREVEPPKETRCVQVLGKMLEVDGHGRRIIADAKRGKPYRGAWMGPYIVLDDCVVTELMQRARKATPHALEHYVRAIAGARDPRTRDFLLEIISRGDEDLFTRSGCRPGTRLLAAVGLAQLDEPAGIDWLIEHCENKQLLFGWAAPPRPSEQQLGPACVRALRDITGEYKGDLSTKAAWQAWRERTREDAQPSDTDDNEPDPTP